jgi:hypothetical protein
VAAVDPEASKTAVEFRALAEQHGFDDAWIAEQQRRGFIARRPATEETPESILVTSKARNRYGV